MSAKSLKIKVTSYFMIPLLAILVGACATVEPNLIALATSDAMTIAALSQELANAKEQTPIPTYTAQAALPTYTPFPTYTVAPTYTPVPTNTKPPYLVEQNDNKREFLKELAFAIDPLGVKVVEFDEDALLLQIDGREIYILYSPTSATNVNKLFILIAHDGKYSNTYSPDLLELFNELHRKSDYKFSIESDGDIVSESMYVFGEALDVQRFSAYLIWYEDREDSYVRNYLGDYLDR